MGYASDYGYYWYNNINNSLPLKTIGIIGTRRRDGEDDYFGVWKAFRNIYVIGDSICSGLCREGGDRFAVLIADRVRLPDDKRIWHPADWGNLDVPNARIRRNKYGKLYNANAGFDRDGLVARDSDVIIACVAPDRRGGTEDTIRKFLATKPRENLILV